MFALDQSMHEKGYRYKIDPTTKDFDPLYAKELHHIGPLMRSYPNHRFNINKIVYDWKISDLFQVWKNSPNAVVKVLADDHPGLTAAFIAQGLADKILKLSDVNMIANTLIEFRVNETPA
jgi:hypothetical protein